MFNKADELMLTLVVDRDGIPYEPERSFVYVFSLGS